ncbi:MAG: zinc ABC transporter substrate-binding protein [Anaerolineae bacterium]|nr:zinc ABC transporter substrate-binding protein [Anaerolineae bacterium]
MRKLGVFWGIAMIAAVVLIAASGCRQQAVSDEHEDGDHDEMPELSAVDLGGKKLQVVATTSMVGDVVRNVGGDLIELTMLVPLGSDPHAFVPTPQDMAGVADAHVLFANGLGLEEFLPNLLKGVGGSLPVIPVSYGIEPHQGEHEEAHQGDHREGVDPHTWLDPNHVMTWTHNIAGALSALDPAHAEAFAANAEAYIVRLQDLDAWIETQIAEIPEANHKLVTDHTAFGYFAARYGLEQVGAVFPGYSSLSEPSAQELAQLEDAIREAGIKAVFVGLTVNPDLAERVVQDTGARLVFLYTGSLSDAAGPASDYISYMRYNVVAIVDALR